MTAAEPASTKPAASPHSRTGLLSHLVLLWIAGACLRMTILAVPPVLPAIHHDLRLNEKLVGALTSLPVLLLAGAAVLGSLLVARLGPRRALLVGLGLVTVGGAARGLGSSAAVLFAMTFLMGVGVAVSQPALPSLVHQWFPRRSALATAIYANGQLVGEIVAASLTLPLVLPLVGGSWQRALAVWSLPVLLTIAVMARWTPHIRPSSHSGPARWWPDWRSNKTWRLGLILGCASVSYFGANAFIPDYLKAVHAGGNIGAALTALNLGQFPASLVVAAAPGFFVARRGPVVAMGAVMLLSAIGLYAAGVWVIVAAAVLGFSTAMILVSVLALPPLLADEDTVHRLSAAMFAITYAMAFAGSLVGGALWDLTDVPGTAFAPILGAGPFMAFLVVGLELRRIERA